LNSQIPYLIGEAFRGWKNHRLVIIPSLITIFLCTSVILGSVLLLNAVWNLNDQEQELYQIEAFFGEDIEQSPEQILQELGSWKMIDSLQYVSAAQAMKEFSREFGTEMLELVEGNPLPPSLRLRMAGEYGNSWDMQRVENRLLETGWFQEVRSSSDLVAWIEEVQFDLWFWPLLITLLLIFTLWLIIANAVRLTLYSRRLLVENMKYAGGSSFFIQFPFILEGGLQGFAGSLAASLLSLFLLWTVQNDLPVVAGLMEGYGWILLGVVGLVTLIAAYTSYRAVQSFLMQESWDR